MTNLAEMLSRGEAPSLDVLLALCPDERLVDLDDLDLRWKTPREHETWWQRAADLHMQYPGFQFASWKIEHMKYRKSRGPLPDGRLPYAGAPLSEFVGARISHAKALWSGDISVGWTQLQFPEWLQLHIDGKTWIPPLWPNSPGWSEALQVLRIACGLARFDQTITCRAPHRGGRPNEPAEL